MHPGRENIKLSKILGLTLIFVGGVYNGHLQSSEIAEADLGRAREEAHLLLSTRTDSGDDFEEAMRVLCRQLLEEEELWVPLLHKLSTQHNHVAFSVWSQSPPRIMPAPGNEEERRARNAKIKTFAPRFLEAVNRVLPDGVEPLGPKEATSILRRAKFLMATPDLITNHLEYARDAIENGHISLKIEQRRRGFRFLIQASHQAPGTMGFTFAKSEVPDLIDPAPDTFQPSKLILTPRETRHYYILFDITEIFARMKSETPWNGFGKIVTFTPTEVEEQPDH